MGSEGQERYHEGKKKGITKVRELERMWYFKKMYQGVHVAKKNFKKVELRNP